MMKKVLAILAFYLCFMCSIEFVDADDNFILNGEAPAPLLLNGKEGVWLPVDVANKMLADLNSIDNYRLLIEKLTLRLTIASDTQTLLKQQLKDASTMEQEWKKAAEENAKALAKQNKWYKSPYLWTAVGFVLGSATVISFSYALK